MFDAEKRISRFREILDSIKQEAGLSCDFDNSDENLYVAFYNILRELRYYDLEFETCVELIDLLHFGPKNGEKSTVARFYESYECYSDYMLKSYLKLGLDPNDNLLRELIEFDIHHEVTVDQLVTSGWFYYQNWPLIDGLENLIFKSKNVFDIMLKVALEYVTYCMFYRGV